MPTYPRLIFMGTPTFAVASLKALIQKGYPILAVVTAPDKPQGRKHQVIPSAVETFAIAHHIPVLKPKNLTNSFFIQALDIYQADLYVVVAFRKLPKAVWNKPRLGTINVHASLLPQYRGAAPINWALIKGEQITGITTFLIDETIDTGRIVLREQLPIYQMDTVDTLSIRLQYRGAQLLLRSIEILASDTLHNLVSQYDLQQENLEKAPKIYTEDCQIDWDQSTDAVFNFIRGLAPIPGAWTVLNNIPIKIKEAYPLPAPITTPGTILSDGKTYLYVATQDGVVAIDSLQPAGRRAMSSLSFLQGYSLNY